MSGPCRAAPRRRFFAAGVALNMIVALAACGGGAAAPQLPDSGEADIPAPASDGSGGSPAVDAPAIDAPAIDAPAIDGELPVMCSPCTEYGPVAKLGNVIDPDLKGLSGIAVSRRNPGVLYVHNDGPQPVYFAINEAGATLATFGVTGAAVLDVEDMAIGPCPDGNCVYLADIGDNRAPRPDYTILRMPEPAVDTNAPATLTAVTAEQLRFTYPDGAHNAESLLVDPRTSNLYVITKVTAGNRSAVYRLPAGFGQTAAGVATKVTDLAVSVATSAPITGADAHPCGTGFLLRTNDTLFEFRIPASAPFEDAFQALPVAVPIANEKQGEAVAYSPDGRAYYMTSEGDTPPIHRAVCR
ncbi:MAG TPA: hypothetical protein VFH73_08325 [Polyangia bacterium]|jgi:hypothetical protein|nr:hypothetical protein [Polyangia bacterium]